MEVGGQSQDPAALILGKRPGERLYRRLAWPRAGLDGSGKSRTRTFQPVTSHYTD